MKKINNKGFMMAEIIVVAVVIVIGLVGLFTTFIRLFISYEKEVVYDSVDAIYASKGIALEHGAFLINNGTETDNSDDLGTENKLYSKITENDFFFKNKIVKSYILIYSKEALDDFLSREENIMGNEFKEYIKKFKENNDFSDSANGEGEKQYKYIIITQLNNNCDGVTSCSEADTNNEFGYYKFNLIKKPSENDSGENDDDNVDDDNVDDDDDDDDDDDGVETIFKVDNVRFEFPTRKIGDNINPTEFYVKYDVVEKSNNIEGVNIYLNKDGSDDNEVGLIGYDEFTGRYTFYGEKMLDPYSYNYSFGKYYIKICPVDSDSKQLNEFCVGTNDDYVWDFDSDYRFYIYYKFEYESSKMTVTTSANGKIKYGSPFDFTVTPVHTSDYKRVVEAYKASYFDGTTCSKSCDDRYCNGSAISGLYCGDVVNYDTTFTKTINYNKKDFKLNFQIAEKKIENNNNGGGGTCLAEGTKVLLANGKYKNIEDIDYNDLLMIYDHENGTISYQYPSWIETSGINDNYILITFDDNTELKVVKDHGIFSLDYNEYVKITDGDKFKIGSRVVKINNGKLEEVKVKNIQIIEEEVKYYFMFTNRHFNLITNDILTGSPDVFIYNFHGFNEDLTWKIPLLDKDIYSYEELSEVPYYLYRGMRLYEGKYFNNYGMDKEDYLNFIRNTIINDDRTVKPKLNENGKREWMVTTSEDIVAEDNKLSYLMEEGSYYTLKAPKNIKGKKFIGWLHTGENIMYQPGDEVEVLYGTHFIAIYQDLFSAPYQYNKLIY